MRSALRTGEQTLVRRIASRLEPATAERINTLIEVDDDDDAHGSDGEERPVDEQPVLARIKEAPGNVSLETMLAEIARLLAVRALALSPGLFEDVAPSIVACWRARAAVESPSHLRDHPEPLRLALLGAAIRAGAGDH